MRLGCRKAITSGTLGRFAVHCSDMNSLDQLKKHTIVVADTGNFQSLAAYAPQDATTNPSLILKAVRLPEYAPLLTEVCTANAGAALSEKIDALLVRFGCEILRLIPGRVSTEVDARLSFDRDATVTRARGLIARYRAAGIDSQRILIKIAATWEGIQAAEILQREGIDCNLTLLFNFAQAVACAEAKVKLISPFVGRIYDWHKKAAGTKWQEEAMRGANDPGVRSVRQIWNYFKAHGIQTEVMGASFRNVEQILALSGCDLLTISPELLGELAARRDLVPAQLHLDDAKAQAPERRRFSQAEFLYALSDDAMAYEKLGEGIRAFAADAATLDTMVLALG